MNGQRTSAVTVVVPALNEEASIGVLLDALALQTSAPNEVIVVDSGSTDGTRTEAEARADRFHRFQMLECPGAYPGRARNEGASIASNDRLVFLDCGISIDSECIRLLADASTNRSAVYGWVIPRTETLFTECAAIAYLQPVERGGEPVDRPTVQVLSIDRDLFRSVNGFRAELRSAEDLLFLDRLKQASPEIGFASSVTARWDLCASLGSTFHRFRTYSLHNLRAGLASQWQRPLAIYYAIWAGLVGAVVASTSQWLWAPLLLVAFVALRAGRRLWHHREHLARRRARRLIQLPVVTAILFAIDLATFVGAVDYLFQSNRSLPQSGFAADEPNSTDA